MKAITLLALILTMNLYYLFPEQVVPVITTAAGITIALSPILILIALCVIIVLLITGRK